MLFKYFSIVLFAFITLNANAASRISNILYPFIEEEITHIKLELDNNQISEKEQIDDLKLQLDILWDAIKKEGFVKNWGTDAMLRPSYITMQGIIETAIAKALENGLIQNATVQIVAPRMPTPLMLPTGNSLSSLNLSNPQSFALYRNPILIKFLQAGGTINAYYSYDARSVLVSQGIVLEYYYHYCRDYPNLINNFIIRVEMAKFPKELAGAVYTIENEFITIQSKQVTQIDNNNNCLWAIKFGKFAKERKNEVNDYIHDY